MTLANLLDDLAEVLGADVVAKLRAKAERQIEVVDDRTRRPFGPLLLAELERRGIHVRNEPPPGPPPKPDAN